MSGNDNIFLIGFMGVGKSTNGALLSSMLATDFIETDRLIENRCGMSIPDIFKIHGEAFFREQEISILQSLGDLGCEGSVVSCGGGIVTSAWCRAFLKKQPFSVLLTASVENCYRRTLHSDRPLLQTADPMAQISRLMQERHNWYFEAANWIVNTDSRLPQEVCIEIIKMLNLRIRSEIR